MNLILETMVDKMIYQLIVDDEFKQLIPPLSSYERKQLEENIYSEGCREPLCVWNNIILDGHIRYDICTRFKIPFSFICVPVRSREEAISWICATQLERRNITEEARKYLIGKRYEMEKRIGVDIEKTVGRRSERLAKEYGIHHVTIEKYGTYARAIDILSKTAPELPAKILSGQVHLSHKRTVELMCLSQEDIRQVSENLKNVSAGFAACSTMRGKLSESSGVIQSHASTLGAESVKDMPAYDPDAEILSLALTIPSWINSISRIHSCSGFQEASVTALRKLEKELTGLRANVYKLLSAIKENN